MNYRLEGNLIFNEYYLKILQSHVIQISYQYLYVLNNLKKILEMFYKNPVLKFII